MRSVACCTLLLASYSNLPLDKKSPKQVPPTLQLAKYEPATGCYLGAFIDFDPHLKSTHKDSGGRTHKIPEEFERIVGKQHAIYFFYMGYGHPLPKDWVGFLAQLDKFVHIALEPNQGLGKVKEDAYLQKLADDLSGSGAKVFLRFASEMNGRWTNYHGDPALYREKFRLVSRVMRERAPNVAMVWCPFVWPQNKIAAYYPGHEALDWVGVNFYNVTYHDQNLRRPAMHEKPTQLLRFVYKKYSVQKPIMICEYGVTRYSRAENKSYPEYAVRCIRELYGSLRTNFPRVKAINYFNSNNITETDHAPNNDYTVTGHPKVLKTYQELIASSHFLAAAPTYLVAAPKRELASNPPTKKPASQEVTLMICADTGKIATGYCPERAPRRFLPSEKPKETCVLHR